MSPIASGEVTSVRDEVGHRGGKETAHTFAHVFHSRPSDRDRPRVRTTEGRPLPARVVAKRRVDERCVGATQCFTWHLAAKSPLEAARPLAAEVVNAKRPWIAWATSYMFNRLDKSHQLAYSIEHMIVSTDTTSVLERQLLLQLGDRLKRLRKAQGLTAVEMAKRVGISRTTLNSVESGDPAPTIGTYLRVMSALGVAGDFALLASDTFQPAPANSAAATSRHMRPQVQVLVTSDSSRHQAQDLQSLALHKEAVRLISANPDLLARAQDTLKRWRSNGLSRSDSLWAEWEEILAHGSWRKALGRTRRAQELRQASPLPTVLPEAVRRDVLAQVQALKKGVVLGDVSEDNLK